MSPKNRLEAYATEPPFYKCQQKSRNSTPDFTEKIQPSDPSASRNPDVSGRSEGIVEFTTESTSIAQGASGIPIV
jgi:hypothetical protein